MTKISETCACGASFEAQGEPALRLYRAWVKRHRCPPEAPQMVELRETSLSSSHDLSADYTLPEMHIGFRYIPEDDDEAKRI